jgi:hypothetical protein
LLRFFLKKNISRKVIFETSIEAVDILHTILMTYSKLILFFLQSKETHKQRVISPCAINNTMCLLQLWWLLLIHNCFIITTHAK